MVGADRFRNILHHDRLADARRGDDQAALALAERGDDVDHPAGLVLGCGVAQLQVELLIGIQRGQVVEIDPVAHGFGIIKIDRRYLVEAEIAFAVLGRADLAFHRVTRTQAITAHDLRVDIDVVGPGEIAGIGRAHEAETIGHHLDGASAHHFGAGFGGGLQDAENDVLLAQGGGVLDAHFLSHGHQFGGRRFLEFLEVHVSLSASRRRARGSDTRR